ncbi:MAG: DNA polymerase IV [Candidatus Staskawiczbacteria bacterium]|nr:DNA polymerase IV [Candidatus Staskawiczbacteria bacterium]
MEEKRIICHLDMDAFFASVEEAKRPHLKGKPIAVGSEIFEGVGRGVVSTANYKAREYGIHSAMAISKAWQISEEARKQGKDEVIFLPVDFKLYNKVSAHVSEIIRAQSALVEQASVDEFYFDLSSAGSFAKAEEICRKIKAEIKATEKVTCSVGIGPNKLISKIAAGMKKPDGMMRVEEKEAQEFLRPLGIRELPGIGPKTAEVFYKKGIRVVGDLLTFSAEELREILGKHGESLYFKARGIDDSPITEFHEVKSIGEQTTFAENTLDAVVIYDMFKKLLDGVFESFLRSGLSGFKGIAVTVRFADFQTQSSSKSFKKAIGAKDKKAYEIEALRLLLPYLDRQKNPRRKPLRLIGIRIEKVVT